MKLTFRVASVSKAKRQVPVNRYTDAEEGGDAWRVTIRNDRIPDHFLDLWYQEEADARRFPSLKSLSLGEVFGNLGNLGAKLKVRDISKERKLLGMNRYTDKPQWMDAWAVRLLNEREHEPGLQQVDLWYPTQKEASEWSWNQSYQAFDLLRVFKIIVTFYPAHEYVAGIQTEGYFDELGFHKPGFYPHGTYPAGYFTGEFIALEPIGQNFGHKDFLLIRLR